MKYDFIIHFNDGTFEAFKVSTLKEIKYIILENKNDIINCELKKETIKTRKFKKMRCK